MKDKDKISKPSGKTGREYKSQQISFFPDLSPLHKKEESPDTCKNTFLKDGLK